MVYTVTVTQRNVFEIDDEDEELQNFRKSGGSVEQYAAEQYICDETLGIYTVDINVEWALMKLGEL